MVVVVIIGILTSIAIPNYQRYQRKARQLEPKLILGGIYTSNIALLILNGDIPHPTLYKWVFHRVVTFNIKQASIL